jgi:hypothetical protein
MLNMHAIHGLQEIDGVRRNEGEKGLGLKIKG